MRPGFGKRLVFALLMVGISAAGAAAQITRDASTALRLGIVLPAGVAEQAEIKKPLDELGREACDREAIANLGAALKKAGYRRQAAVGLATFSEACSGDAKSLRTSSNILLDLSDYKESARIAGELIKLEPLADNGYFLRAVAHERGGNFKGAIDDYATALELYADNRTISSTGYLGLARSQEKLGQHCDAAFTIESWVAINPARNETTQARTMIAGNLAKGKCASAGKMEDTFPVSREGNVVVIAATVNGIKGRFVLDTGATWVSIRRSFADKAKVEIEEGSALKLHTAGGISDGRRGRARTVQLKTVKAADVPVIVQTDDKGAYGDGIDGLLGMSFLSRFNVATSRDRIRISSRTGR